MSNRRDLDAKASDALEAARELPHGPARSMAMKEAGQLRVAADKERDAIQAAYFQTETLPKILLIDGRGSR